MRIPLVEALISLRPDAHWIINGDYEYSNIDWKDENTTLPTEEEINNEIARLETLEYQRQRAPEYPSIGDQLDALFHAGVFPPEMAAQIQAVKDKYPKG
jgi:hypothetical protein